MLFFRLDIYYEFEEPQDDFCGEKPRIGPCRTKKYVARQKQKATENFNDRLNGKAFFCLCDYADGKAKGAVISVDTETAKKYIPDFVSDIGVKTHDTEITEITLRELTELLDAAAENDYLDDESAVFDRFGLYDIYGNIHRFPDLGEKLIENKSKKEIFESIRRTLYAKSLLPEAERIYAGKSMGGMYGHPCQYMLLRGDSENLCDEVCDLLLSALYRHGRLRARRYLYTDIDPTDRIMPRYMEKLYRSCSGGCVIIRYRPSDDIEETSFASVNREMVEMICQNIKKFRNDTLTLLCIPRDCTRARALFYEYLDGICLVECREEFASSGLAAEYLRGLCRGSGACADKKLYAMLDADKSYRTDELKTIFDRWYDSKLRTAVFPQYKDMSKAETCTVRERNDTAAYEKLSGLVGLGEAKKSISKARDYFVAQRIFRDKGFKTDRPALSMIFTGNPGSAKTTVARLVAEIFRDCGILSRGNLIECGRGDLVGKYVGWTAQQVQRKFKEARGSVLFIDEAYSLVDDRNGSFGDEAINTIVQEMENHRDDVLVIFAGYPDKMEEFMNKNPGLRSRIAFHVHFDDYNADELCDISAVIAKQKGLNISANAMEKLHTIYEKICTQADFGNGRAARNIIESAKMSMASRLLMCDPDSLDEKNITTILPEDICEPVLSSEAEKPRRKIGF